MEDVGDHRSTFRLNSYISSKGTSTMAAGPYSIDPTTYLDELLTQASPDLMREMLQGFINQILSTQADQVCGADYATVSDKRTNVRNGYTT